MVLLDFLTLAHRDLIIALAARYRLPAGYALRVFAVNGGLFSYGVDAKDLFRRGAAYVSEILKGAKPAYLPVQQPTKYESSSTAKPRTRLVSISHRRCLPLPMS